MGLQLVVHALVGVERVPFQLGILVRIVADVVTEEQNGIVAIHELYDHSLDVFDFSVGQLEGLLFLFVYFVGAFIFSIDCADLNFFTADVDFDFVWLGIRKSDGLTNLGYDRKFCFLDFILSFRDVLRWDVAYLVLWVVTLLDQNLHEHSAAPLGGVVEALALAHILEVPNDRCSIDVLPKALVAIGVVQDILGVESESPSELICGYVVPIHQLKLDLRRKHRLLRRQPELLVPVDWSLLFSWHLRIHRQGLGLVRPVFEHELDVSIYLVRYQRIVVKVHRREFLTLEKADLYLVQLCVQSRRHHNLSVFFKAIFFFLDQDLLVALAFDGDGDLQVGLDLVVVVLVGVAQRQPLVRQQVVLHKVDVAHVEFEKANQIVLQKASVDQFDEYLGSFGGLLVDSPGLEEDVFVERDL